MKRPAPTRPGRSQAPTLFLAVVVALAITALLMALFRPRPRPGGDAPDPGAAALSAAPPEALAIMKIPEFTLTDQNGRPATREIFSGRYTILAFTFTHCPVVCPSMNSQLLRLQEELKDVPVRFVSISVDPAHDTPEVLKAHAERLGADALRWSFLTGDADAISRIVAALQFDLSIDTANPISLDGGGTISNIVHPSKLLLIGPKVTVLGMESGLDWAGAEALLRQTRQWLSRQPPER